MQNTKTRISRQRKMENHLHLDLKKPEDQQAKGTSLNILFWP
ncbi:hypothetical protein ALQ98_200017 [Pseudomonas syringae pv. lapsa]|uniref:Uncharacterized protein n=1 Tax=Pseudomonas syringae pv. lapsa TaxID=199201 RepID=A0AB74A2S8_PSESX|nr:hypothetical protein ALQ98_200017 [Pseudomonas syringae pv. lapsa]